MDSTGRFTKGRDQLAVPGLAGAIDGSHPGCVSSVGTTPPKKNEDTLETHTKGGGSQWFSVKTGRKRGTNSEKDLPQHRCRRPFVGAGEPERKQSAPLLGSLQVSKWLFG